MQDVKRYGYIYKIVFPNGKIYIGKHTPKDNEDFYTYVGSGTYIKNYLKNHDKSALKKIIINQGIYTEDELFELEYIFVRLGKKLYKDKCMNFCDGGSGYHKGYKHSKETIKKISIGSKNNWLKIKQKDDYDKFIKNRANKRLEFLENHPGFMHNVVKNSWDSGNQTGMTGQHHTEETKNIISKKLTGRIVSEEARHNMSVAQKSYKHKPHSQETKDKISKTQKGNIHITDGKHNKVILPTENIPKGWWIGWTADKKCETIKNSYWINNGIDEIYCNKNEQIPDGWTKGRLKRKWYTDGMNEKWCLEKDKPSGWKEGRSEIYNKRNKYTKEK